MIDIFMIIIGFILGLIIGFWITKLIFNIEKNYRIVLCIVFIVAFLIPFFFFIFDYYNIPLDFDNKNIDVNRWFNFFTTFFTTFISTTISGLVLIWIMLNENKQQINSSKNDKRIENAPLIKYYIKNDNVITNNQCFIFNSEGEIYNIFFGIENIGLNHAKRVDIILSCNQEKWIRNFKIENEQSILKKDEMYWFDFVFNNDEKVFSKKELKIIIIYFDMLNNKYEQEINVKYEITSAIRNKRLMAIFSKIDIKDEQLKSR